MAFEGDDDRLRVEYGYRTVLNVPRRDVPGNDNDATYTESVPILDDILVDRVVNEMRDSTQGH